MIDVTIDGTLEVGVAIGEPGVDFQIASSKAGGKSGIKKFTIQTHEAEQSPFATTALCHIGSHDIAIYD